MLRYFEGRGMLLVYRSWEIYLNLEKEGLPDFRLEKEKYSEREK